jgi:hypothetical protein
MQCISIFTLYHSQQSHHYKHVIYNMYAFYIYVCIYIYIYIYVYIYIYIYYNVCICVYGICLSFGHYLPRMRENMCETFLFLNLASLDTMSSNSIHLPTKNIISFFFMPEYYSIVYIHHAFLIHS